MEGAPPKSTSDKWNLHKTHTQLQKHLDGGFSLRFAAWDDSKSPIYNVFLIEMVKA